MTSNLWTLFKQDSQYTINIISYTFSVYYINKYNKLNKYNLIYILSTL